MEWRCRGQGKNSVSREYYGGWVFTFCYVLLCTYLRVFLQCHGVGFRLLFDDSPCTAGGSARALRDFVFLYVFVVEGTMCSVKVVHTRGLMFRCSGQSRRNGIVKSRHTVSKISVSIPRKSFITVLKRGNSKGSALTGRVGTVLIPANKAV